MRASVLTPDSLWIATTTGLSYPRVTNTHPPEKEVKIHKHFKLRIRAVKVGYTVFPIYNI